jgi:cytochrome P450
VPSRTQLSQALTFGRSLYAVRFWTSWYAHARRDPMARLRLRPGRDNPYVIYEELRRQGTMVPTRLGNWVTTSYALCAEVLRDRRMGARPADSPVPQPDEDLNLSFVDMNPPDHTRLRRLAAPAFSPRQIAGYRPLVEKTVHRLIDDVNPSDTFDLVSSFAAPLPIAVITDLLGVPDADSKRFAQYGAMIGGALDGIRSLRHARDLLRADAELTALFTGLFELRRREPSDDVVSRIVAAEGTEVRPEEMQPLVTLLLIAGFETTVNLIGNGVLALSANPAQWEALRDDPAGVAPLVVEEALRYDPPVQRTARLAQEETEVDGRPVRKDQAVITLLGAANRDPQVFARPNEFDVNRTPEAEHLAFSAGIHYCLGAPLARMEAAVAFQTLAERLPGLHVAGRVRRRNATTLRGPLVLPVRAA